MRFTRGQAILLALLLHIVVPGLLVTWHFLVPYGSVLDWAAVTLVLVSYVLFIYLVGSWAFASYYVRYALALASTAAVLLSLVGLSGLPLAESTAAAPWLRDGLLAALSVVLLVLAVKAFAARFYDQTVLSLSFPFKGGVHSVFEGGNGRRSALMNYHYGSAVHGKSGVNNSMKYAVDITRLSAWGTDAQGAFPRRREQYPVFHETVLSPCDSLVAAVSDGQPNEEPWSGKGPYNLGNYVLLRTGDHHVLLGHLQAGSIQVKAGDPVKAGQPIAQAGNSGWTSQPHLHIQAMRVNSDSFWKGEGVPISFDRRNPFKNRLFFR